MVLPAYVDQEYGIDLIIPFIFRDKTLQETNVSAVIIQSKNDKRFTATPTHYLFKMMRPYHIRFFNEGDIPVPIIRMVFALGSPTPCVTVLERPLHSTSGVQQHCKKHSGKSRMMKHSITYWASCESSPTFMKPSLRVCKLQQET